MLVPGRRRNTPPLSYRDAGVDIDAGNALVQAIKPLAKATRRRGADAELGGFGALFDLKRAGFKDPILVAANDGVGTKLKIAIDTGQHTTIGIDLVAMCVNDLLAQGAEPLFFLDYFACGRLDVATARSVVAGIADGCRLAGCALIGGETAEMPGLYAEKDYDLAGFAVGAVEREGLLPRADIDCGDVLLGLAASGVHSNGYSLVRRLVAEERLTWDGPAPFAAEQSLAEALLTPTRIYVKSVLSAIEATGAVKAIAHITGGGMSENLPRVLPQGLAAHVDLRAGHRQPSSAGCKLLAISMIRPCCARSIAASAWCWWWLRRSRTRCLPRCETAERRAVMMGAVTAGRGIKSPAKGKGSAEAVEYVGSLGVGR